MKRITGFSAMAAMALIVTACLNGCAWTVDRLGEADSSVSALMKLDDASLTPDCRAGLAEGWTSGATLSADIKNVAATLKETATPSSTEYVKCKNWGAWGSFKARAGKAKADRMLTDLIDEAASVKAVVNALKTEKPQGMEKGE
jgi:hypothetical protein